MQPLVTACQVVEVKAHGRMLLTDEERREGVIA